MPIGVVGAGTDSASVDGYSPAGSVALRNMRQTPAAEQVWDAETITAAANSNLEDMRATYLRLGVIDDTDDAATASQRQRLDSATAVDTFNGASASPPPLPLPPPQPPHTVTTSRRPGAPPPTHLMSATPMPTYQELTSTNARRNAVPKIKVINLARKGRPSPSAGGGNALAQKAQRSQQRQSRYRQSQNLSPSQRLVQRSLGQTQQTQRIAWLASPCGPPSWQL